MKFSLYAAVEYSSARLFLIVYYSDLLLHSVVNDELSVP